MSDVGDVIGGRFLLTEYVAYMDDEGRWRCPRCEAETNSYGHHACTVSSPSSRNEAPDAR